MHGIFHPVAIFGASLNNNIKTPLHRTSNECNMHSSSLQRFRLDSAEQYNNKLINMKMATKRNVKEIIFRSVSPCRSAPHIANDEGYDSLCQFSTIELYEYISTRHIFFFYFLHFCCLVALYFVILLLFLITLLVCDATASIAEWINDTIRILCILLDLYMANTSISISNMQSQ